MASSPVTEFEAALILGAIVMILCSLTILPAVILHKTVTGWRARSLRSALREKGYDGVSIAAAKLLDLRGERRLLMKLPARDELAVVPGFEESDGLLLLDVSRILSRSRRRRLERRGRDFEHVERGANPLWAPRGGGRGR
jgi:hypothetical protein